MTSNPQAMRAAPFTSRWCIRGTLTTLGPLHVGDGGAGVVADRSQPASFCDNEKQESDAATVCTDALGHACIPGSAIKGALRARIVAANQWDTTWDGLLGSKDASTPGAQGGKVEFSDALIPRHATPPVFAPRQGKAPQNDDLKPAPTGVPPYWNGKRWTGVVMSVCIDRRTRAAAEQLLYSLEYVPAGVAFDFELTGENLSDPEISRLLALLEWFNTKGDAPPLTLGAQASNIWGRMRWQRTAVERFTAADLAAWLVQEHPPCGYAMCRPLDDRDVAAIAAEERRAPGSSGARPIVVNLDLHFPGPLLVRDPEQQARAKWSRQQTGPGAKSLPDATSLLDENGYPILPAKAVRGVLRSHAEAILRTIGAEVREPPKLDVVRNRQAVAEQDLIAQLFGGPGWRAPLATSAFAWPRDEAGCPIGEPGWRRQEFVAIDRFTGGAGTQKKFDASAVVGARLHGQLTLDLDRLEGCPAAIVGRGIVALLLRDLIEGDLSFGSKAAIGYGACIATGTVTDGESFPIEAWLATPRVADSLAALRRSLQTPTTTHA